MKHINVTLVLPERLQEVYEAAKKEISVSALLAQALEDWYSHGVHSTALAEENKQLKKKLKKIRALTNPDWRTNGKGQAKKKENTR